VVFDATGDIFASGAEVLVNTVNCVGVMGKGLALEVKQRFPKVFEDYRYACGCGLVAPGRVFVSATGLLPPEGPRFVVNLPTKRHWREPSRLDDVRSGLVSLAEVLPALGVASVSIPALGCANGGLFWGDVRPLIFSVLGELPIRVLVYPPL
jgi:O-acetyl-ADP-ribose deacetylase (regulator of RNase III)